VLVRSLYFRALHTPPPTRPRSLGKTDAERELSTEDPTQAEDPSIAADLASSSGFFFTGGVQTRVVDVFLPEGDTTEAHRAVWTRQQEGAVVSGAY
jgi:cyanophycinase-like exopeptidase